MEEVITRRINLPDKIRGFTVKDDNDDYNIYLNERLDDSAQIEAYNHEMKHISYGHFYESLPVFAMENEVKYGER